MELLDVGRRGTYPALCPLLRAALVAKEAQIDRRFPLRADRPHAPVLDLLERVNRELGGSFDPSLFAHDAIYNETEGRIEMHLRSLAAQEIQVLDEAFAFAEDETIHTENSHKYTVAEFQALARSAGWEPREVWTGDAGLFSLHYLTPGA